MYQRKKRRPVAEINVVPYIDVMLVLLAKYFKQQGMLDGNMVVTTVMANVGLKKSLEEMDIISITTPVGDKYVAEAMLKNSASLGGEQSGHIILSRFLPVGDGLLTAIFVLNTKNKELNKIVAITQYDGTSNLSVSDYSDSLSFNMLTDNQIMVLSEGERGGKDYEKDTYRLKESIVK